MMRLTPGTVIFLCVAAGLLHAQSNLKGPLVDRIQVDARAEEGTGLADVAAGRSDLWVHGADGAARTALAEEDRAKLDAYEVTGASYESLLVNPYPDAAPYTVITKEGKTVFNPLAIREVRYALNFLIDRGRIVAQILGGAGAPMYTPVPPGQPGSSRYALEAALRGLTAAGDESRALADISSAMRAAAALPENKGRMGRSGAWWTYDGQPVSVRFLIRADDLTVRLPEGRYIADQIEKAGIRVERQELDPAAARALWNGSDPADLLWGLYTESWETSRQTDAFWETSISQMYAPRAGAMPGAGSPGSWKYRNDALDRLSRDVADGRPRDAAEYHGALLKAAGMGLEEAVRIFVAARTTAGMARADRLTGRMMYGLVDGLDKWSLYTADVTPGKDKTKVLRLSTLAVRGALLPSPWDPIGSAGFADANSALIASACSDQEAETNPFTGVAMAMRTAWAGVRTRVDVSADDGIVGKNPVPRSAVLWNAERRKWESGIVYRDLKGDGVSYGYEKSGSITSFSQATFAFRSGRWHDGRPVDLNDYRYALSLPWDISFEKTPDDRIYDREYAAAMNPRLARFKGFAFNRDGTLTVYADAAFPADQDQLAGLLCPRLAVQAGGAGAAVPWEILEVLEALVSEGSASRTRYSYNSNPESVEVDLLDPRCTADIKAKLQEFVTTARVPPALRGFLTPVQAVKAYQMALDFIEAHAHAFISNGGFILDSYDPAGNTCVLAANRDAAYPFTKGYFARTLAARSARIDSVKVPLFREGAPLAIDVGVSEVTFPGAAARPAPKATVKVTVVGTSIPPLTARFLAPGSFEALIPERELAGLEPGSYPVVVEAAIGPAADAVAASTLIVF